MKTKPLSFSLLCALAIALTLPDRASAQPTRFILELEGGAVWQSSNTAEIPNNGTATRFSLRELTGSGPWPAGRVYLTWNINEKHALRALAAPLSITERGVSDEIIDFEGGRFAAGTPLDATYTFNSYRLTYRYRFRATDRTDAWIGFTGKIRDATVALTQGETLEQVSRRKDNVGFVPLLHVAADWRATPKWVWSFDGDGLAGGPGRAFDVALKAGYHVRDNVRLNVGYRTVEGGADVDEVYNFAWLHYAVGSVTWRW